MSGTTSTTPTTAIELSANPTITAGRWLERHLTRISHRRELSSDRCGKVIARAVNGSAAGWAADDICTRRSRCSAELRSSMPWKQLVSAALTAASSNRKGLPLPLSECTKKPLGPAFGSGNCFANASSTATLSPNCDCEFSPSDNGCHHLSSKLGGDAMQPGHRRDGHLDFSNLLAITGVFSTLASAGLTVPVRPHGPLEGVPFTEGRCHYDSVRARGNETEGVLAKPKVSLAIILSALTLFTGCSPAYQLSLQDTGERDRFDIPRLSDKTPVLLCSLSTSLGVTVRSPRKLRS